LIPANPGRHQYWPASRPGGWDVGLKRARSFLIGRTDVHHRRDDCGFLGGEDEYASRRRAAATAPAHVPAATTTSRSPSRRLWRRR